MSMQSKKVIDVRGLPCPQPVIRSRRAMEESDLVEVLVTQKDQVGNVSRMAQRSGWTVSVAQEAGYFRISLRRGDDPGGEIRLEPADLVCSTGAGLPGKGATVVLCDTMMGRGEEALGTVLMKAFIGVLMEVERRPERLILYNRGVKLAVAGSPVLEPLRELSDAGVEILACGTCLDYFGEKESLEVGVVSNMYDIAEAMLQADRLVVI